MRKFPHYPQLDSMDCGPTCLRIIAKYYGADYTLESLRRYCNHTNQGVSMLDISDAAEHMGFRSQGVKISVRQLTDDVQLPCVLYWNQSHFVVCYKIKKTVFTRKSEYKFYISDPAGGRIIVSQHEFEQCWTSSHCSDEVMGIALLLLPTPDLYNHQNDNKTIRKEGGLRYFAKYLIPHRFKLLQLITALGITTGIQIIFPFLSQSIVDNGIGGKDLNLITLILIAQLILFCTQVMVDFFRSWIALKMTTEINISLISDFLIKLMYQPISFFGSRRVGDILQRVGDHDRIQSFLTGTSVSVIFSLANFLIFGFLLAYYSLYILGIFLIGNTAYVLWILFFMRRRRDIDQKRFSQAAADRSNMIELITGMQDIKLSNSEKQKRWRWENIQKKLFKINQRSLILDQYQQFGSSFFNKLTSLLISFMSARAVVTGSMTLGMMMSISYIIGQLSSPIFQFIEFARSFQDAKLSLERLEEIHKEPKETSHLDNKLKELPIDKSISLHNVWFKYEGSGQDYVLKSISVKIPQGKTTAIVGSSGSGKTTLLKLILGFYQPNKGVINIGSERLQDIDDQLWRKNVGAVMQDGFIFSDSIAENIAVGSDIVDRLQLKKSARAAHIDDYISSLPLSYNTKIGMEGNGLSQGQKQRLLIARAIYKNPLYLFFDEATNSLDATNEREIMKSLEDCKVDKTVVIIAHRLSTVQNADKIVVMDNGKIVEQGTHNELVENHGVYYGLVKNQLELGL